MQLSAHIVVALIGLVVVGGATRVMEAGLACPDWPLCFGSFFPGGQMNVQVFLEWFHRLDAFLVGSALLVQFIFSLVFQDQLPRWIPLFFGIILLLVVLQAVLGAITVLQLLPSSIVTSHLAIGLTLIALVSGLTQRLRFNGGESSPVWWRIMGGASLISVFAQSLLGGRMATAWASQKCIAIAENCQLLDLHRLTAIPVASIIFVYFFTSIWVGGWFRSQWPLLTSALALVVIQIALGISSVYFSLNEPLLVVAHQLVAALLVAFLSALSFSSPSLSSLPSPRKYQQSLLEACNG